MQYAFYICTSFTGTLTIPDSVILIGQSAFAYCSGLKGELIIGNSVMSIENSALTDCSGLTSITSYAISPPALGINVFNYEHIPIYVSCGTLNAYQNSAWGIYFTNFQEFLLNYTITSQSNNNTAGQAEVTQEPNCDNGYQAVIQATANNGYRFVKWNDNNTNNPRTVKYYQRQHIYSIF